MVVEDELDINGVVVAMFEAWGIAGTSFVGGRDAIEWIEAIDRGVISGELPQLALIDIRLPDFSGPEVGEKLRRSKFLHNIAIVLTTAYRLTPTQERAVLEQAQADALIYKPLPAMPELRKTLNEIIVRNKR
jgi:CheY-like chemotaxis protein